MSRFNVEDLADELGMMDDQWQIIVQVGDKQYDGFMLSDYEDDEVLLLIVDIDTEGRHL